MLQPGDTIDIWVVESALGSGGMGSVYRCHNRAATRILAAVKVLDGGLTRYPEAEARFIREAEILFQLDHPNIVKVRNVRIDAEPPYLEMEFVAGESLDERLKRGPVPYAEAVALMRQVSDAVAYLHSKGIRHRDIKPANLLVQYDRANGAGPTVKLVDFGLAVEADGSRITQTGMAFGTVSYAPPEWIAPETLDPTRWDIYALGVVFHELLTGTLVFPVSGHGTARQQAMQVIIAKQGHPPLDPGPAFHDDVRQLIGEMTHPDPSQRLSDAAEVARRVAQLAPSLKRAAGVTLTPGPEDPFLPSMAPQTESVPPSEGEVSFPSAPRAEPAPKVRPLRIEHTLPVSVPGPRRAFRATLALGVLGVLLFGLMSAASIAVAAVWWRIQPEQTAATEPVPPMSVRDVVLEPVGPDAEQATLSLQLDGREAEGGKLSGVPVGRARVTWVAGDHCGARPLPRWCTSGEAQVAIEPGTGPLRIPVQVEVPRPREVSFALPGLPESIPLRGKLGESEGVRTQEGLGFTGIAPGSHTLTLAVGSCPEDRWSCEGSCEGCRFEEHAVVVPAQGSVEPAALSIAAPAPAPAAPKRPSRGSQVTRPQLASFLEKNPDWAPGGRMSATSGRYLTWWPDDKDAAVPASGVTPALAEAYCHSLGLHVPSDAEEPALKPNFEVMELRRVGETLKAMETIKTPEGKVEIRPLPTTRNEALSVAVFRCVK